MQPGDEPSAGVGVARGARIESKYPAQALVGDGAVVRALAEQPEDMRPDSQTEGADGEGAGMQTDFFLPYLRYTFGCIGIHDIRALKLERMTRGDAEVAASYAAAAAWIDTQITGLGKTSPG